MSLRVLNGRLIDPWNLTVDDIDEHDLIVSLCHMCRFNGHLERFYSVAQHSLRVHASLIGKELRLAGLLHDAHEAYSGYGDVADPVKIPQIVYLERKIDVVVAEKFGFDVELFQSAELYQADKSVFQLEYEGDTPYEYFNAVYAMFQGALDASRII